MLLAAALLWRLLKQTLMRVRWKAALEATILWKSFMANGISCATASSQPPKDKHTNDGWSLTVMNTSGPQPFYNWSALDNFTTDRGQGSSTVISSDFSNVLCMPDSLWGVTPAAILHSFRKMFQQIHPWTNVHELQ